MPSSMTVFCTKVWLGGWNARAGGAVTSSLRMRRLATLEPALSAMARHAELPLHGAVLHVPDTGEQSAASGANGRQLGAGNSPGFVVHWPPLEAGGGGGF